MAGPTDERSLLASGSGPPPRQWPRLWREGGDTPVVGVASVCYNLEKLAYGLPHRRYRFRRLFQVPLRRLERRGSFFRNTPIVPDRGVAMVHTMNQLPVGTRPFVVSFERELPRYLESPSPWQTRCGVKLLRSDRCRQALALTEAAKRRAVAAFSAMGEPEIAAKVAVHRGGVPVRDAAASATPADGHDGPLRALFVGRDAFRKGLVPTVDAMQRLRDGGVDARLTVISKVDPTSYAIPDGMFDADAWRRRLDETEWIDWRPIVPNAELRGIMAAHDVCVFPSLDETLGWIVIESAFEGTPCITTGIFAFPELIDEGETGSMATLPLDDEGVWAGLTCPPGDRPDAVHDAHRRIADHLVDVLARLAADRGLAQRWGDAARAKLLAMYHPDTAAAHLESVYDAVLR